VPEGRARPTLAVVLWRGFHAALALGFLGAIAEVWRAALSGRRSRRTTLAAASLLAEGAVVAANGGDCPLGPLGDRIGDETPLFELVLPPRAAKAAVPVLGLIAGTGILLAAIRGRPGLA
jgi:hypothetical protein